MSTPTDDVQDCIGGQCEECDDWGGGTCALCDRYFCGNCWSTPAHDCAAALTGDEARGLAKRWVWLKMTNAEKLAASRAAYAERGLCPQGLVGMFTYGTANPGYMDEFDCERLFAWVRERFGENWAKPDTLMPAGRHLSRWLDIGKADARSILLAAGWPS